MSKCSHEGHMPGKAASHLKKMHSGNPDHSRVHGRAAGAGDHAENENRPNRGFERKTSKDMREDG